MTGSFRNSCNVFGDSSFYHQSLGIGGKTKGEVPNESENIVLVPYHADGSIAIKVVHPEREHQFVLFSILQIFPSLLAHRAKVGQDVDKVL